MRVRSPFRAVALAARLALVPALGLSRPAAAQAGHGLDFYSGSHGDGSVIGSIPEEPAREVDAPAGLRSVRLRNLKAGVVFELYASPTMAKRIDPMHPGTVAGGAAWTRITTLRDVSDYVVGRLDITYADRFVRVEYNGPGEVDGQVRRIKLYGVTGEPVPVRFAHLSDLHVNVPPDTPSVCSNCPGNRTLIAALNRLDSLPDSSATPAVPVSFALITGDIANIPQPLQVDTFEAMYRALRMPYHLVSGNHDTHGSNFYKDETSRLTERQHGGLYLYSFNFGGVHFVAQHTNCPFHCSTRPDWDAANASLEFLERDLRHVAAGVPVVVFQHYGFDKYTTDMNDWPRRYRDRFLALLGGRNLAGLLTGHDHPLQLVDVPGHGTADFLTGSVDDARGCCADRRIWVFRFARDTVTAKVLDWNRMAWQPGAVVRPVARDTFWSAPGWAGASDDTPAFATVNGTRYMLWSARGDRRIRVAALDTASGRWVDQGNLAASSPHSVSWGAVAAVALHGRLTVVWHKHNTGLMYASSLAYGQWTDPVELPGMTVGDFKSPAAAVLRDTLHVVFNDSRLWHYELWHTRSADGRTFTAAVSIPESETDNQPALVARGSELSLVWAQWQRKVIFHQSWSAGKWSGRYAVVGGTALSERGPGLAWNGDRLFLAWSDETRVWQASWRADVWSAKALLPMPALVSHRGVTLYFDGGELYAGWNGDGNAWLARRAVR